MATRNNSEVEGRRSPVHRKRTQTRPSTQASYAAMGSSCPRSSTRGPKAPSAKRSSPTRRSRIRRRPSSTTPAIPVEIYDAIEDQRQVLATAITLLHCLHCVLRCKSFHISPEE
jgi:hypothetical protein